MENIQLRISEGWLDLNMEYSNLLGPQSAMQRIAELQAAVKSENLPPDEILKRQAHWLNKAKPKKHDLDQSLNDQSVAKRQHVGEMNVDQSAVLKESSASCQPPNHGNKSGLHVAGDREKRKLVPKEVWEERLTKLKDSYLECIDDAMKTSNHSTYMIDYKEVSMSWAKVNLSDEINYGKLQLPETAIWNKLVPLLKGKLCSPAPESVITDHLDLESETNPSLNAPASEPSTGFANQGEEQLALASHPEEGSTTFLATSTVDQGASNRVHDISSFSCQQLNQTVPDKQRKLVPKQAWEERLSKLKDSYLQCIDEAIKISDCSAASARMIDYKEVSMNWVKANLRDEINYGKQLLPEQAIWNKLVPLLKVKLRSLDPESATSGNKGEEQICLALASCAGDDSTTLLDASMKASESSTGFVSRRDKETCLALASDGSTTLHSTEHSNLNQQQIFSASSISERIEEYRFGITDSNMFSGDQDLCDGDHDTEHSNSNSKHQQIVPACGILGNPKYYGSGKMEVELDETFWNANGVGQNVENPEMGQTTRVQLVPQEANPFRLPWCTMCGESLADCAAFRMCQECRRSYSSFHENCLRLTFRDSTTHYETFEFRCTTCMLEKPRMRCAGAMEQYLPVGTNSNVPGNRKCKKETKMLTKGTRCASCFDALKHLQFQECQLCFQLWCFSCASASDIYLSPSISWRCISCLGPETFDKYLSDQLDEAMKALVSLPCGDNEFLHLEDFAQLTADLQMVWSMGKFPTLCKLLVTKCLEFITRNKGSLPPIQPLDYMFQLEPITSTAQTLCTALSDALQSQYLVVPGPGMGLYDKMLLNDDKLLRIAFVSGAFAIHPTTDLILEFLVLLKNSGKFNEVWLFSTSAHDGSKERNEVQFHFGEKFVQLHATESPKRLAHRISEHKIHVLIELDGYIDVTKQEICLYRPAPLQMSYMGFPGGTQNPEVDYIVADKIVLPEHDRQYYRQSVIFMPHCYLVSSHGMRFKDIVQKSFKMSLQERQADRARNGLPDDAVVYCCFSQLRRISADLQACMARIVSKVPHCVLWVLGFPLAAKMRFRQAFRKMHLENRLVFAGNVSDKACHIQRICLADICLDTLDYNGHTTGLDVRYAGLPVVYMQGNSWGSRVSCSQDNALDPEHTDCFKASDLQEYETLAVKLGSKGRNELFKLRQDLFERAQAHLFNTRQFAEDFTVAISEAWRQHKQNQTEDIVVSTLKASQGTVLAIPELTDSASEQLRSPVESLVLCPHEVFGHIPSRTIHMPGTGFSADVWSPRGDNHCGCYCVVAVIQDIIKDATLMATLEGSPLFSEVVCHLKNLSECPLTEGCQLFRIKLALWIHENAGHLTDLHFAGDRERLKKSSEGSDLESKEYNSADQGAGILRVRLMARDFRTTDMPMEHAHFAALYRMFAGKMQFQFLCREQKLLLNFSLRDEQKPENDSSALQVLVLYEPPKLAEGTVGHWCILRRQLDDRTKKRAAYLPSEVDPEDTTKFTQKPCLNPQLCCAACSVNIAQPDVTCQLTRRKELSLHETQLKKGCALAVQSKATSEQDWLGSWSFVIFEQLVKGDKLAFVVKCSGANSGNPVTVTISPETHDCIWYRTEDLPCFLQLLERFGSKGITVSHPLTSLQQVFKLRGAQVSLGLNSGVRKPVNQMRKARSLLEFCKLLVAQTTKPEFARLFRTSIKDLINDLREFLYNSHLLTFQYDEDEQIINLRNALEQRMALIDGMKSNSSLACPCPILTLDRPGSGQYGSNKSSLFLDHNDFEGAGKSQCCSADVVHTTFRQVTDGCNFKSSPEGVYGSLNASQAADADRPTPTPTLTAAFQKMCKDMPQERIRELDKSQAWHQSTTVQLQAGATNERRTARNFQIKCVYASPGDHGICLYAGEDLAANSFVTFYDGRAVNHDSVTTPNHVLSMENFGLAIDGRGFTLKQLADNFSMGCLANHTFKSANCKYDRVCYVGLLSQSYMVGVLKTRHEVKKHDELLTNYGTQSCLLHHSITKPLREPGQLLLREDDLRRLKPSALKCLNIMASQIGFTFLSVKGVGSFGLVLEVSRLNNGREIWHGAVKLSQHPVNTYLADDGNVREAYIGSLEVSRQRLGGAPTFSCINSNKLTNWHGPLAVAVVRGKSGGCKRYSILKMSLMDGNASQLAGQVAFNLAKAVTSQAGWDDAKSLMLSTSELVRRMHTMDIAHGDLKWSNYLIRKHVPSCKSWGDLCKIDGEEYYLRLGDFGASRFGDNLFEEPRDDQFSQAEEMETDLKNELDQVNTVSIKDIKHYFVKRSASDVSCLRYLSTGTCGYRAPRVAEVAKQPGFFDAWSHQRRFDKASDVWSLGILLCSLITGKTLPPTHSTVAWEQKLHTASKAGAKMRQKKPSIGQHSKRATEATMTAINAGGSYALASTDRSSWVKEFLLSCEQPTSLLEGSSESVPEWKRLMDTEDGIQALDLLAGLWEYDYTLRLNVEQALQHKFFKSLQR